MNNVPKMSRRVSQASMKGWVAILPSWMGTSANDFLNAGFVKKGSEIAAIVDDVVVGVLEVGFWKK